MDVSRQITDISYMQNVSATVDYAGVEKILNDFFMKVLDLRTVACLSWLHLFLLVISMMQ